MNWISVFAASTPVLVALLGGVGWLYRHERERRVEVERQLSDKKYGAYMEIINIFFDLLKDVKLDRSQNQDALISRMMDANKELIIYGSDEVVDSYLRWMTEARSGVVDMEKFGDIVISVRRDMGNPNTRLESHDILRMMLTDYEEAKESGALRQEVLSQN